MKFRAVPVVALVCLSACTTGGISLPPGSVCPSNFAAPGISSSATQISTNPAAKSLPSGTYTYSTADIYYTDTSSMTHGGPFEVQLHDGMTTAGINSTGFACTANVSYQNMKAYSFNLTAVTDMGVDALGNIVAYTRTYAFSTNPNATNTPGASFTVSPLTTTGAASITAAIAAPPTVQIKSSLVSNSTTDYQMTTYYVDQVQGTYTVIIHMNYNPAIVPTNVIANQKKQ